MVKVFIKLYDRFTITGNDFPPIESNAVRRTLFSPDGRNSISLNQLPDDCLVICNESDCPFTFSISREHKVFAVVKFQERDDGHGKSLAINTNWLLYDDGLTNIAINTNPDLVRSAILNIDVQPVDELARADLKVATSSYAAMVFSRELHFIKMNGHHTVPRLLGFIDRVKRQAADAAKAEAMAEALAAAEAANAAALAEKAKAVEEAKAAALEIGRNWVVSKFFGAE